MIYKNFELPDNMRPQVQDYVLAVIDALEAENRLLKIDSMAVYSLAESYGTYLEALEEIDTHGMVVPGPRGNLAPNPAIKIARDSKRDCLDICRDFGLTLASRGRIKETAQATEVSPLQRFMADSK